ncbi:hypothetical protein Tco_0337781 [Tanacetum coccineum]
MILVHHQPGDKTVLNGVIHCFTWIFGVYDSEETTARFGGVTDWYQSLVTMSSATSDVTYTSVYTDSEPAGFLGADDEEISEGGIPTGQSHPDMFTESGNPEEDRRSNGDD